MDGAIEAGVDKYLPDCSRVLVFDEKGDVLYSSFPVGRYTSVTISQSASNRFADRWITYSMHMIRSTRWSSLQ